MGLSDEWWDSPAILSIQSSEIRCGSAKREFISGPRAGTSESISNAEVEQYRELGEDQWGKYVPGGLFSDPKFIPGAQRKQLPVFEYEYGAQREIGWIDEDGVHYYSEPKVRA